jgi:hypothetical protein
MRRLGIALTTLAVLLAGCGGARQSFSGSVANWRPVDRNRISVTYDVHNDGSAPARVGCILDAVIPSGNTIEKTSFTDRAVRPGSWLRISDVIPIPGQGAFLVADVTAGHCERFATNPRSRDE